MSLPESRSPLDYPILTPSVSFISLCASFDAVPNNSRGTLTLTDIDHVSIMKSSSSPHRKVVESPTNVVQNLLAYMGIEPHQIPRLAV